jgi:hypothetical protein
MITVDRFADPAAFLQVALPLLDADRARSTIISTVSAGLARVPEPDLPHTLVAARDAGRVVGLAVWTPPHPLTVLIAPGADASSVADALAAEVRVGGRLPDLLTGPQRGVAALGAALTASGGSTRPHTRMLLYRLTTLAEPTGVEGVPRVLDVEDPRDLDLAARWVFQFEVETRSVPVPDGPRPEALRRRALRGGVILIWEHESAPVALAGHTAVVAETARIGPVYTPEPLRGNRYGSAATAAAVRSAQRSGAETVVLFTDADYPASNAVYRRLGFQPVDDFLELEFVAGE